MKISHLGAKDCVTGSCHLVETRPGAPDSVNILVDCGTAAGDDPVLPFARFPVSPDKIDYLFLTHAHIDHIGRVPDLIDAGFRGEIICTHATKALLPPMLRDALSFSTRTDKDVHRPIAATCSSWNRPMAIASIRAEKAGSRRCRKCCGRPLPIKVLSISPPFPWAEPRNCCTNWTGLG